MLSVIFFFIAFFYSMVGFGGGSSYVATLVAFDVSYLLIPKIGLLCNLLVVSGGCWHYFKQGHFNLRLTLPFLIFSVPFAFLGGMYPIKENSFLILLGVSLFFSGLRLLGKKEVLPTKVQAPKLIISMIAGALLGFLSGLVSLGGGIFLAPLMLNLHWGSPKEVAATSSGFIFLNSLAGLGGQFLKESDQNIIEYWPLFLMVFIGGQIGSRLGTHHVISGAIIQKGTALLILLVSGRIFFKIVV